MSYDSSRHYVDQRLRTCSFGRRGRPSYAVRTQAEVQRLCHFANVSVSETGTADTSSMLVDSQPARDSVGNVEPSRGTGVQGAAEVRVANTHDGCVRGDVSDTAPAVLESALLDYKSQNPNASDEDAIHHILKHKLPATLPNTPAWHRSNLQDLLCMVDRFGMPSFFLTLTTDEVSATRWPEVQSLEQKLQDFCAGFTWQDAPAENAFIAHKRVQSFMTDVLKAGRGAVHTNAEFNVLLAEARKYRDEFLEQHHVKPASTYLYNITAAIHEGDMPDRATATHAEVMQLWIAAAGSLRADTAIELIYDYGMDAGTVLKTDQDFARSVLTAAQQARASGALLTTTTPAKRAASSPAEPDSSASPRTVYVGQSRDPQRRFQAHARNPPSRMKEDASRYQPFHDHFSLTRLMSTANPALAQRMEAFYIAQFKARGPGGYNVLCGPPSASPAFYAMRRQRAGSAHTPTAVTAQDNDDDAPDTLA
ncbi:hypothetical protein VOLCADRAFT_103093 [Volvox carteri f. nagariensis]|uniref:Helitron helicase-like domain-containing protein n=1 Tax=Volvox carteri f. nagariensis TaxID=3068 RepID=D8TKL8_VOLCA|nr:uncharacterized protein VOLCADRAFT_103093 [Volvox carteri f. nagariensis]EFJ52086.1 hypothetical protein VOLCADRAFT_103093 [Volvox carteri f. nagariensis]|eukprot:XP_002946860.1 hypothetical protein VOLCADRAFT_103093 [Volvox carteri f. nagariensis]